MQMFYKSLKTLESTRLLKIYSLLATALMGSVVTRNAFLPPRPFVGTHSFGEALVPSKQASQKHHAGPISMTNICDQNTYMFY